MPDLTEGKLKLQFASSWAAVQIDSHVWYRDGMGSCVKAMDMLAVEGTSHWWIEIKDCAGYEPENLPRLSPSDPPEVAAAQTWIASQAIDSAVKASRKKLFVGEEVAQKFEGTLATLVAARRAAALDVTANTLLPYTAAVDAGVDFSVVLLLCWNTPDFRRLAMRLRDKLRQRLHAYQVQCFILNEHDSAPSQPWTLTRIP